MRVKFTNLFLLILLYYAKRLFKTVSHGGEILGNWRQNRKDDRSGDERQNYFCWATSMSQLTFENCINAQALHTRVYGTMHN